SCRDLPSGERDYGLLCGTEAVAKANTESMVRVDASIYQGFGRPGLEAMAWVLGAVLTYRGGITSYAIHRRNCLLVDPYDVDGICHAIEEMFDDDVLREKLVAEGEKTARSYTLAREGELTARIIGEMTGRRAFVGDSSMSETVDNGCAAVV